VTFWARSSLFGAYLLLGRRSWAALAGCVLLLMRLASSASFFLYSALWMPGQLPAAVELPYIPFLLLQASLWLGPAATLLLALSALFSVDKRRLGAVLLALGACGQPLVFAYEALPGEGFYLSGATILLLGWPSGGINLPEAALLAYLALLLLRGAHQRTLNKLWEGIARENREKARRLYEEGLGRGDLSLVKDMVSEDFRDLRHGERGQEGMERVVLRLRESFPDLAVSVDAQGVERDLIRTRLTLWGTDRGKGVMWYPPPGRRASFSAEFVDRFSGGGELVEHDGSTDTERLLRQLGHLQEDRPDCGPHPSEPTAGGPA
jgi:predicted ester cyclase